MDITRVVALGVTLALAGCQSYERRPLELGDYLADLEARPSEAARASHRAKAIGHPVRSI